MPVPTLTLLVSHMGTLANCIAFSLLSNLFVNLIDELSLQSCKLQIIHNCFMFNYVIKIFYIKIFKTYLISSVQLKKHVFLYK